jgi:two-component system response regulator FixJ
MGALAFNLLYRLLNKSNIPMSKNTVFVIDDDPLIGQAIAWLLETVALKTKIFTDAQAFLDVFKPDMPGCIIIDVRMPGMSGLELQQRLNEQRNPLPVIMISGHGDVPMAVRAMQAGARDFVLKPFNDQVLLEKIQAAITENIKQEKEHPKASAQHLASLTPRERQVMEYILAGKLNKQIAGELNISMSTVELHRARVMHKMQAKSLAELVKLVISVK